MISSAPRPPLLRRGFTLVEIMIVVLIIGILMAIAVPNFVKARDTSRKQSCVSNLKSIYTAKETWSMDTKKVEGAVCVQTDLVPVAGNGYLKQWPACPSGGTYTVNNVGTDPTCNQPGHVLP